MVRETIECRGISEEAVLRAMRVVPRHEFVLEGERDYAYGDYPLPIGHGQTISQPYIVALMTELLELKDGDKVLEVGTGSGYQAAILAELPGVDVYTIEIIPELAEGAQQRLEELGYRAVHCRQGDGYHGWPEQAPFDAILVAAAPLRPPQPLLDQLADGGRLVVPVGKAGSFQTLWKFVKQPGGEIEAAFQARPALESIVGYNLYQGMVRAFDSHGAGPFLCDPALTIVGPNHLAVSFLPDTGDQYYLVTAWNGDPVDGQEGTVGAGRDPAESTCDPVNNN